MVLERFTSKVKLMQLRVNLKPGPVVVCVFCLSDGEAQSLGEFSWPHNEPTRESTGQVACSYIFIQMHVDFETV